MRRRQRRAAWTPDFAPDRIDMANGAVADEGHTASDRRCPTTLFRTVAGAADTGGISKVAAIRGIQRGKDFPALRVHPRRNHVAGIDRARASASSADTGTTRRSCAIASPWIVAIPTRRPVKEPGPAATARQIDLSMPTPGAVEHGSHVSGQPLTVRDRTDRRRARRARSRREPRRCCRLSSLYRAQE